MIFSSNSFFQLNGFRTSNYALYRGQKCSDLAVGDDEVAIKVYSKKKVEKDQISNEVDIFKRTDFLPSVVHLQETFEDQNSYYFVFELYVILRWFLHILIQIWIRLEVENLFDKLMKTGEAYSEKVVANIVSQLVKVIAGLHRLNIVYRDLQPSNVLMTKGDEIIKLTDISSAQIAKQGEVLTSVFKVNSVVVHFFF